MMWSEFERIAGYEVSYEDYTNVIEPMYMATNLTKEQFVRTLNRKEFDVQYKKAQAKKALTKELRAVAARMYEEAGRVSTYETFSELLAKAQEYDTKFAPYGTTAELEKAKKWGCETYVKALVWYDRDWNPVERLELVG